MEKLASRPPVSRVRNRALPPGSLDDPLDHREADPDRVAARCDPNRESQHVLIVDDNADVRRIVAHFLERSGFEVSTAANAKEAMGMVAAQPPDVIVCDWVLEGGGNAPDLVRAIREQRAGVSALFITGLGVEDVEPGIAPLGLGERDILTKPFSGRELLARLRERCS